MITLKVLKNLKVSHQLLAGEPGANPGQYPLLYWKSGIPLGHCKITYGKAEYRVDA